MTILFTSAKFHFYHHGATSISDSFFFLLRKWGGQDLECEVWEFVVWRGIEGMRLDQKVNLDVGNEESGCHHDFPKEEPLHRQCPLGRRRPSWPAQLTSRPVPYPGHLWLLLQYSNQIVSSIFKWLVPMNGLMLGFQQKAWAQPARWESSVTRTSNSVTAIIPQKLLYFFLKLLLYPGRSLHH